MAMQLDLERLLEVARITGALSGHAPNFGPGQLGAKEASLTESTLYSLYGANSLGLFNLCGSNDLLSLTVKSDAFIDWLRFRANNEVRQFVKLLAYVGADGTAVGAPSSGVAAACADANTVEYGMCEILLGDKGRLKRAGPVRDLTENNRKLCDTMPVVRKDGTIVQDELQWSIGLVGETVKQDLKRYLVTGNDSNTGEFDGLEVLVNTGYADVTSRGRCYAMDSYVLDWGSQVMSYEKKTGKNLVSYLIAIIRRIRQRAAAVGDIAIGDMILQMPTFMRDELLNAFTCWSVCPGSIYSPAMLNTLEARNYRNTLNGGAFGMGQIFVDSIPVPIITYDWAPISQSAPYFVGDIYILTRAIGNNEVLYGQYIDMTQPAARFAEESGAAHYKATDGGKFLIYWKTDNECTQVTVVFRPNLRLSAPWAQARIQNVAVLTELDPLSLDPESYYYAEQNLAVATAG